MDHRLIERFLELYDQQIDRMVNGVGYARKLARQIRDQRAGLLGVFAHDGDALVGGCLNWRDPARSQVRMRFSAVEPGGRQGGLVRALYLRAFQAARELGYPTMSLGVDPSLYGHTVQPGLLTFKSRLGFVPGPAAPTVPGRSGDEADLYRRLGPLADPAVVLAHPAGAAGGDGLLRAVVLSPDPECALPLLATGRSEVERRLVAG